MTSDSAEGSSQNEETPPVGWDSLIPSRPFEFTHRIFLERLARAGEDLDCLKLLALNSLAGRRMELAATYLDRILDMNLADVDKFEYAGTLGRIYRGMENLEEAVKWYRRALARTPTHRLARYRAQCHLADCLNRLGHFEESERLCREAIADHPERAEAIMVLAEWMRDQGLVLEAGRQLMGAIEKDGGGSTARFRLDALLGDHPELRDELGYQDPPIPEPLRLFKYGLLWL